MEPRITDKRTIAERYGDKTLLSKKPTPNSKYQNISKVVSTGKTINDVRIMSDQLVSKRKSEMFKRIKGSTIIKLLSQQKESESIYNLGPGTSEQKITDDDKTIISSHTALSQHTTVTAVTYATDMLGDLSEIDFVILDLREQCDYDNYHIKEAISYPGTFISRDKFLNQMIMMKNKESKMIIVYHNDERNGTPYAGLLFQKGYDNIYFLSGGIEDFVKRYPEFVEGPQREILIQRKIEREKAEESIFYILYYIDKLKKGLPKNIPANTTAKSTNTKKTVTASNSQSTISQLKKNLTKKDNK